jgi:hypothetical protein
MQNNGVLFMVLVVISASLPATAKMWREDRPAVIKTLWLIGIYLAYVGLGIALLFLLVPAQGTGEGHGDKALQLVLVMLGWILYGTLMLTRTVPRYREPPRWLMHFGIADLVVLGLMFGSLAAYLWL